MRLDLALTEFAYSKDHSPASRAWYKSRLGAFTDWCSQQGTTNIEDITAPLVRRYLDYRRTAPCKTGKPLDSHTLHGHARVIKALLNWAIREELVCEKVVRRLEMPKREQKVLRILSQEDIDGLFTACDQSETPEYAVRNRAILAVLLDTGIRANELCDLALDRVHFAPDSAWLVVNGKGRKQREVGLGKKSRQLLHKYIHRFREADSNQQHVIVGKGGGPLQPEGLDRLLYHLRDRAGLQGRRISAHLLRHTYAVRYLEQGGDIYRLKVLMGHTSVSTTEGYLRAFTAKAARQGASVFDQLRA